MLPRPPGVRAHPQQAIAQRVGYVTPRDKLLGLETEIWAERDRKLEQARELRRKRRALDHLGAAA